MKKKTRGLIITSLLTFVPISAQVLTSCAHGVKAPEATIPFTLKNDDKKGTIEILDANGFKFSEKAPKNSDIYIKVKIVNEKYKLKQITVDKIILHYDEAKQAYVYHVTEAGFEINVQYTTAIVYRRLNVDLTTNTAVKKVDVYLDGQNEPLTTSNQYNIEVGKDVRLGITCDDVSRITSVLVNEIEATYDAKSERYKFKMPEVDVTLKITTIKAVSATYEINDLVEVKYKNGDKLESNLPSMLTIGATEEFVGTIKEGNDLDLENTFVVNNTDRRVLNDEEVKVTVEGNAFSVKILNVPNGDLTINIKGKAPGVFKGEKFLGQWKGIKTFGDNRQPDLIINEDGKTFFNAMPDVPSNEPGVGMLDFDNDLIVGTLKSKNKQYITRILPLYNESGECYALVGYFDTNGSLTTLFVRDSSKETAEFTRYKFSDSKKYYLCVNYEEGTNKQWLEVSDTTLKKVDVYNDDKSTVPTVLEDGKTYYSRIQNKLIEFKVSNETITSAGIEQGSYSREGMDDIVLDGYGKYTKGTKEGSYKYYEKRSLLILDAGTESATKLTLDLETSVYKDYVKVTNEFTGLIFEFRTVATSSGDPELYRFEFLDDSTVYINNGNKLQVDQECNFDFDKEFKVITFYIPLTCNNGNDRIVKARFNDTFTTLSFFESHLCSSGDLENKVASATSVKGLFTNANDKLSVDENGLSLNEAPVSAYDLYVDKVGDILLRTETASYKLKMNDKTFEVLAPGSATWILNKSFAGTYTDSETNPEYDIKYSIKLTFGESLDVPLILFKVDKQPNSYEGSSDTGHMNYENSVTATFNPNNLYLTLKVKTQYLKVYLDYENETLIFKNDIEVYRKRYNLKNIAIKEYIEKPVVKE